MPIEELVTKRILQGVVASPELEEKIKKLVLSAKEGHLCDTIDDVSLLPESLWSKGEKTTPLVVEGNRLYLHRNWALESLILQKLLTLLKPMHHSPTPLPLHLLPAQTAAIQKALGQQFSIFTGGPGTGKTFTASCFVRLLAEQSSEPYKIAIAAPTGKAAAHLEHALRAQGPLPPHVEVESMTLHRLLKLSPSMQRLGEKFAIFADLVVVDEASMLDASLMLHLFQAIGPHTRLLLLGDPDQLPPIEGGGLFADMAEVLGSKLERSMRTETQGLNQVSEAINAGKDPSLPYMPYADFLSSLPTFVPNPIYATEPDPKHCLLQQSKSRILTALRQGPYGADALNQKLMAHFTQKVRPHEWLALPILVTQNDPKAQLYNGTTGVLVRGQAYFLTGEGVRVLAQSALPRYEIAFCLSVHKSQGSEFDEVYALFPPGSEMFGKEALYTAVTRARKKLTLVSEEATIRALLAISSRTRSGLKERLERSSRV